MSLATSTASIPIRLDWPEGPKCPLCGSAAGYDLTDPANPLESWVCRSCCSTSRDRMYILTLGAMLGRRGVMAEWQPDRSVRILEASGARAHPRLLNQLFDYRNTDFEHDLPPIDGVPVEFADLQALLQPDASFDIVMSSDVFEHVRLYRVAFAEVWRVLKPGGAMLLQAPFALTITSNHRQVLADGDRDVYLEAPQFHAGPALVYRIYGEEVLDELRAAGFEPVVYESEVPACHITRQLTIVARKPAGALTPHPPPIRDDAEAARTAVRPWGVLDRYRAPIPLPAPRVSVIVPCHNHAGTTAAGLAALRRARTKVPFEIIAVDDASSDATPEVLEAAGRQAQRMKVFTLAANAGFSQANNHAAFVAEGEYLVFLNNDTEVRDGWLDALVELLDERRDAGAAGAKLVYPDGRLQEAGGIVFSDGSGWNYGRFDPPDHPDYNRVREVDYASAAALIVRKAAFRRLGGFDVRYSPAYYEDTDLCFGIRELGLKVLYCPFAEVVHHGGVTASTDEQTGAKRFQPINQAKFADKWAARLVEQPVPTSDRRAVRSAADRRARAFVHDVGRLIAAARGRLAERSLASIAAPE